MSAGFLISMVAALLIAVVTFTLLGLLFVFVWLPLFILHGVATLIHLGSDAVIKHITIPLMDTIQSMPARVRDYGKHIIERELH